jgi:hypothetical protein
MWNGGVFSYAHQECGNAPQGAPGFGRLDSRKVASHMQQANAAQLTPQDERSKMIRHWFAPLAAGVFAMTSTMAQGMESYQWKARPVLVFAASADTAAYRSQLQALRAAGGGLRERQIIVIGVSGNAVQAVAGGGARQSAANLRRAYGVPDGEFQVVLIGKDGGVKLRSREPVSPQELFQLVDAMPMRQQEMRR